MFKFDHCFPIDKIKRDKNSRVRIVGYFSSDQLLFLINSLTSTELYLISETGESTLVMSYRSFADIVYAQLSENQELLFFVERISKGKGFGFKSVLWHIHSLSQAEVFEGNNPIAGFFIPDGNEYENCYQFVYIIGPKMVHLKIEFVNKKIKTSRFRSGDNSLYCDDLSRWFFSYKSPQYLVITRKKELILYEFSENEGLQTNRFPYEENPNALLPHELALMANIPMNIPTYKFSRGNMFCIPLGNDVGIVEQLYLGYSSTLTFAVATVVDKYYEIVSIPGVQPDVPINFISDGKIVFVFVVKSFAAFVDFTTSPPLTFQMPLRFAKGPLTDLSTNLGSSQIIVDLNTAEVFKAAFSIQAVDDINLSNTSILSVIAVLCARLPYNIPIPAIIEKLSLYDDGEILMYFFRCFFAAALAVRISSKPKRVTIFRKTREKSLKISKDFIDAVEEMEKEFPSSGAISRSQQFKKLVLMLMEQHGKQLYDECPRLALKVLRRHNESSLLLRSAIDAWIDKFHPTDDRIFMVYLALTEEARVSSAPAIPCLGDELGLVAMNVTTHTMFSSLKSNQCFGPLTGTSKKKDEEIKYWSNRVPLDMIHTREHLSSISFSRSSSSRQLASPSPSIRSLDSIQNSDESSSSEIM